MRITHAIIAAVSIAAVALATAGLASADEGGSDWKRRWRHGESRLSADVDLTRATVVLTGDLVLVSEPYVASHCSEAGPYAGSVTALDRKTGAHRWHAVVEQTSGDQNAYLDAYVHGSIVAFATWGHMRAFDNKGRLLWKRTSLPDHCDTGPLGMNQGDVRQHGQWLEWPGYAKGSAGKSQKFSVCALDLKTGRITARSATKTAVKPRPAACSPPDPGDDYLFGQACDGRGSVRVIATCKDESDRATCQVRIEGKLVRK